MNFGEFEGTQNFTAQYELWQSLRMADTLVEDTTGMLEEFWAMGDTGRYGMLGRIDSLIDMDDTAAARALIDDPALLTPEYAQSARGVTIADDIAANRVVENYRSWYDLYLKYLGESLQEADMDEMWRLANLCVQYDGHVVYNARTLWNMLHDEMAEFSSECDTNENDTSSRVANQYFARPFELLSKGEVQQYNLLPNPNNGNFIVNQLVSDQAAVAVEVWNILGVKVYENRLEFKAKRAAIKTCDLMPGNYLLKLNDSKGENYIIKFTVL